MSLEPPGMNSQKGDRDRNPNPSQTPECEQEGPYHGKPTTNGFGVGVGGVHVRALPLLRHSGLAFKLSLCFEGSRFIGFRVEMKI